MNALIAALPAADAITADNAEAVQAQLSAIDEAMAELSDDEADQLDGTKYEAAKAALESLSVDTSEVELAATTYATTDDASQAVASVEVNGNTTYFTSFFSSSSPKGAAQFWITNGGELKLLTSVTTSDTTQFGQKKTATLDLNGYTWTYTGTSKAAICIASNTTLTITDTSTAANGKLTASNQPAVSCTKSSFKTGDKVSITLEKGTIESTGSSAAVSVSNSKDKGKYTSFTMNGGTVTNTSTGPAIAGGTNSANTGVIEINDGTVSSSGSCAILGGKDITVSGGAVTCSGGSAISVEGTSGTNVIKLTGGTISTTSTTDGSYAVSLTSSTVNNLTIGNDSGTNGDVTVGSVYLGKALADTASTTAALNLYSGTLDSITAASDVSWQITSFGANGAMLVKSEIASENLPNGVDSLTSTTVNGVTYYGVNPPALENAVAEVYASADSTTPLAQYTSLAEAVSAATDGQVVKVLATSTTTSSISITKAITLDLNNYKVEASLGSPALTVNASGKTVTIKNGTVSNYYQAINAYMGSVVLEGVTATSSNNSAVRVGSDAKCSITSGTYTSPSASNVIDNGGGTISITGGTFSDNTMSSYVASGYSLTKKSDGTYSVVEGVYTFVAKVGSTQYSSLASAIEAASAGDTVTLLDNVTLSDQLIISKSITLDLGEKTLAFTDGYLCTGGDDVTVTVQNGTVKTTSTASNAVAVYAAGGTLNLNATVVGNKAYAVFATEATVNVNGGSYSAETAGINVSYGATVNFNDGTVSGGLVGISIYGDPDDDEAKATLKVSGGLVSGSYYGIMGNGSAGNTAIEVSGGTISGTSSDSAGIYHPQTGTLSISGGTISGAVGVQMCSGTLTVSGTPTITASGSDSSASKTGDGSITDGAAISLVSRSGYGTAPTASISGGTFKSATGVDALKAYAWSSNSASAWEDAGDNVEVSAGTFSTQVPYEYCAANYIPTTSTDSDGNTVYTVKSGSYAASVTSGETMSYYETLSEAVSALTDGATLTLLANATEQIKITVPGVTFDLNGHSVTYAKGIPVLFNAASANEGTAAFKLVNTGSSEAVLTSGNNANALNLYYGGSDACDLTLSIGENIKLVGKDGAQGLVNTTKGALVDTTDSLACLVLASPYKVSIDGQNYVYNSLSTAASKGGSNCTVTMLKDISSSESLGGTNCTLDLGGHTYTYTGSAGIVRMNSTSGSQAVTIKNGTLKATKTCSAGLAAISGMTHSNTYYPNDNSSLTLDGVALTSDVTQTYGIVSQGLDTGTKITLTNSSLVAPGAVGIYAPAIDGVLTITDSTITAATGINVRRGTVNISETESGKTVITGNGSASTPSEPYNGGANSTGDAVYVEGGYDGDISVNITGGTFTSTNAKAVNMLFEDQGTGTKEYVVSGGSFSSEVPEDYCANGYIPASTTDNEGNTIYGVKEGSYVASVTVNGETKKHESLAEAIEAAGTEGTAATITLLADVTETVTIPSAANITLDLAAHTLANTDGNHTITNNGTLTVTDTSTGETKGTVDNTSHGKAAIYNTGTCTVGAVNVTRSGELSTTASSNGGNSYYIIENVGTMNLGTSGDESSGPTVAFPSGKGFFSSLVHNGWYDGSKNAGGQEATLNVYAGTYTGGKITIKNDDYGVLNMSGGTVGQPNAGYYAVMNAHKATISGGTIESTGTNGIAVYSVGVSGSSYNDGGLTITGGAFKSAAQGIDLVGTTKVTVSGSDTSFTVGEGYNVTNDKSGGTASIAISGGSYNVEVQDSECAENFQPTYTADSDGKYTVETKKINVEGYVLDTGETLKMYYYVSVKDSNLTSGTFTFTADTNDNLYKSQTVQLSDCGTATIDDVTCYKVPVKFAAKDLTAEFTMEFTSTDGSYTYKYPTKVTAQSYAHYILDNSTVGSAHYSEAYAKAAPLVRAMLNYGTAMQTLKGFNTDKPANSILTDAEKAASDSVTAETITSAGVSAISATGETTGVTYYGTSLITRSEVFCRVYFKLASGAEASQLTFAVDGSTVSPTQYASGSDIYYVDMPALAANKLGDMKTATVTVTNGSTGGLSVSACPMSWAATTLASSKTSDANKAVARAMYTYWDAAKTYFGASE